MNKMRRPKVNNKRSINSNKRDEGDRALADTRHRDIQDRKLKLK